MCVVFESDTIRSAIKREDRVEKKEVPRSQRGEKEEYDENP